MAGLNRLIEPVGQLALARQGAMPLAGIINNAANLPLWQFQFEQGQHRVGPSGGLNQPFDPAGIFSSRDTRKPPARLSDDVGQQLRRDGARVAKPARKLTNIAPSCMQCLIAKARFTHAPNIRGRRYEFESGGSAILYERHKAA